MKSGIHPKYEDATITCACGNVIHTMGEAVIQCHGMQLLSAEPEQTDERH